MTDKTDANPFPLTGVDAFEEFMESIRRAAVLFKDTGLCVEVSGKVTMKSDAGDPITLYGYEDLKFDATGFRATNVEVNFVQIAAFIAQAKSAFAAQFGCAAHVHPSAESRPN